MLRRERARRVQRPRPQFTLLHLRQARSCSDRCHQRALERASRERHHHQRGRHRRPPTHLGQSAADRARETYGIEPKVPEIELPADLSEAETVGLLFDEVDGLNFLRDFGRVEETFADPALADEPKHREVVLSYLEDPSISPGVLRRLAERDPQQATQVFRRVLQRPRFSWDRDGEALLRRHKAKYFAHPVLPSVTPVSEPLARAQLTRRKAPPAQR